MTEEPDTLEDVLAWLNEGLAKALVVDGPEGNAIAAWVPIDRVLLARDRLAVIIDGCDHEWGGAYTDVIHQADDAGYVDLPDGRSIAVGLGHSLTVAVPVPGTFACSRCGAVRDPAVEKALAPLYELPSEEDAPRYPLGHPMAGQRRDLPF